MARKRHRKCRFGVNKRTKACLKTKRSRKSRKGSLSGARRRRRHRR